MWSCVKCSEQIEESHDVCWNCGTSRDGTEDANFVKADDPMAGPIADRLQRRAIDCLRCQHELDFVGTKAFHEGMSPWGLGASFESCIKKETFDVYRCSRCGRVEFFAFGIGEGYRPE